MKHIFTKLITNEYKAKVDHGKVGWDSDPLEFANYQSPITDLDSAIPDSFSGTKSIKHQLAGKKAQQPIAKMSRDISNRVRDYHSD